MAWKATEWAWLLAKTNPQGRAEAERRVTAAIYASGGVVAQVARELKVSVRSAWYFIEELDLQSEVERARARRRKRSPRRKVRPAR